jgi:predicted amidohydrolase YtcJ
VAVGQPADFAVLDADPFDVSPTELAGMPVSATFLGGRTTHSLL